MSRYVLALSEKFTARHFFPEKRGMEEGIPHPHDYRIEIRVDGGALDKNGYLIDLDEIDLFLKEILSRYSGVLINNLPEFSQLAPSLEHFAQCLYGLPGLLGRSLQKVKKLVPFPEEPLQRKHRRA